MSRLLLAAALALALAACGREVKGDPVAASCDNLCFTPCPIEQGIAWTGDPLDPGAWDNLGDQVISPLKERGHACDTGHRGACHRCLLRLQEQGLIVGIPPLPEEPAP